MIPLPPEYEAVEAKLKARLITGTEASQAIFVVRRRLGPPWRWKTWQTARMLVLGTACETCGAGEEAILCLQHTVRLPKITTHKELARNDLAGREVQVVGFSELRQKMDAIRDEEAPGERDCCPKCYSLAIQYRKKAATWTCNSKSTGSYCAHVFTQPSKKSALTADQKNSIKSERHGLWRDAILSRDDDWMRDAMLAWIDEMRVYLSLRHTKTLCKRCAFLEDMTDLKPCGFCGFAYPRIEQFCPDCEQSDNAQT